MGIPRWLSGLAPPLAQGMILGSRDRVPHRAPYMGPASPSACVAVSLLPPFSLSLSLSLSLINKILKKEEVVDTHTHTHTQTRILPSHKEKKEILPFATTWNDLRGYNAK